METSLSGLGTLVTLTQRRRPQKRGGIILIEDAEDLKDIDAPDTKKPASEKKQTLHTEEFLRDKLLLEGNGPGGNPAPITSLANLFAGKTFSRFVGSSYTAAQRHELRGILRRRLQQALQGYYESPLAMRQLLQKTAQPALKRTLVWAFMNGWLQLDDETLKLAYVPLFAQGLQTYGGWLRTQLTVLYPDDTKPPSTYLGGGTGDTITMALVTNNLETLEVLRQIYPVRLHRNLWEESAALLDSETYQQIQPATRAWLQRTTGIVFKDPEDEEED